MDCIGPSGSFEGKEKGKNMGRKTIFFIDIDGTLVGADFVLSSEVIRAAKAYQSAGGQLTLCTGRSVIGTRHIAEGLGASAQAVLYNGAALYDFQKEKILWKKPMDREIMEYIRQIYKEHPGICMVIFTDKNIYRIRTNWMVENKGIPEERGIPVQGPSEIKEDILKITFVSDHEADLHACREYFQEGKYRFDFSGRHFAELVRNDSGKHLAAKELIRCLGDDYDIVFAAGNGENDIELLKQSDYSFAPVTAVEQVKQSADHIINSPEQNGMKEAFEAASGYKRV